MSKLAYVMMTLVGAIPAGGANYVIVKHFLDNGFNGSPVIIAAFGTTWVATFLTVLTPLMVLFWYKGPQKDAAAATPAAAAMNSDASVDDDAKPSKAKKGKAEGFDDAIPDDFDENELSESASGDDFEDDNFDGDSEAFEDIEDDFEDEDEKPKKKKKK